MIRRAVAPLLLAPLVAACGVTPTEPFLYGDAPHNAVEGVRLVFLFDERPFVVMRSGPRTLPGAQRLALLFAGPNDVERAAGVVTAVPEGYTVVSQETKSDDSGTQVVVVDRPGGVDLFRFGPQAGEQIACTVFGGSAVLLRDTDGHDRGPFGCHR